MYLQIDTPLQLPRPSLPQHSPFRCTSQLLVFNPLNLFLYFFLFPFAQRSMLHSASSFSRTTLSSHSSLVSNPPSHLTTTRTPAPLRSWSWSSSKTRPLPSYSTSTPPPLSHIFRRRCTAPGSVTIHRRISPFTTQQLALATHKALHQPSQSSSYSWSTTYHIKVTTLNHNNSNNRNNNHRNRSTEHPSFLGPLLLDELCRPQILQQTAFPSYAMFSTPKASTADIACNESHLPHESGLSRGKQGKGQRRKNNKPNTNSTLSVAVLQSSPVPVSPSSELSVKKLEELPWVTPSQERSCSPATPLPTERTAFDAFTPLASPLDGSCTLAKLNDSVQSTTPTDVDTTLEPTPTGLITPRSRPKPSPIATKALHRSTSLSHSAMINSLVPEPTEGGPHSSDNSAGIIIDEGLLDEDCPSGRDSGIAIESWGPSLDTDKDLFKGPKDPFPSFDQLFQPSDFATGNTPQHVNYLDTLLQRCGSLISDLGRCIYRSIPGGTCWGEKGAAKMPIHGTPSNFTTPVIFRGLLVQI